MSAASKRGTGAALSAVINLILVVGSLIALGIRVI
jgi:hypothetical protein